MDEIRKAVVGARGVRLGQFLSGFDELEKARNVGEIHPNGKWVWVEYKPGKFDWRVAKKKDKAVDWGIHEPIEKMKSVDEMVNYLVKEMVVTRGSDLSDCDLASAKMICGTMYNLKQRFNFDAIRITATQLSGSVTAQAIAGRAVDVNSKYYKAFDNKRYYRDSHDRYKQQQDDALFYIDQRAKRNVGDDQALKRIADTKKMLEAKKKKFPCWTSGTAETAGSDVVIHEMGHILNGQCTGGCGTGLHRSRTPEYVKKSDELNKLRNETFARYIKEDVCVSEYSTVKPAEFFAECFVAWVKKDVELPKYVNDFFDKYFKETTPKRNS